ncbi:hypothetical protein S4A8_11857 [Salinisphaera sp. S4-8]
MSESDQFERLINYCVVSPEVVEGYDLADITTSNNDDGIDGCCITIDQEVIVSAEDCASSLSDGRRQHDVKLIFTQAKTSESMDLGDVLKFNAAIERFCHNLADTPEDPVEKNVKNIYLAALDKAGSIRNGKLSLVARYAYTGKYKKPAEIEKAKAEIIESLEDGGYFSEIDYEILDREGVNGAFRSTMAPIEAKVDAFSVAALPTISGVEEAYLAVVPAKVFVKNMLSDESGRLRAHVFEENVRAFLGIDNSVNSAIESTVNDDNIRSRFPVLNNGITIVSPDVRVQGLSITFVDFQVVNGCQTSNILWLNREKIDSSMMVSLKVIETDSEDVFSDLVKATNSQTKIDDDQFLSLQPVARRIEAYFNSFSDEENRLYFERRDRQYVGQSVPGVKIFDLKLLARCVSAIFLGRPDLSYRFPKKIFSDESISNAAFHEDNREIIYYTACLIYYRVSILFSNKHLPSEARRFKWHIMALFARRVGGTTRPKLTSRKIEKWCETVIDYILNDHKGCREELLSCLETVNTLQPISDDRLKRQAVYEELIREDEN